MVPSEIEREIVVAARPERVWEVITSAEHLGRWFADAGARIELRPGGLLELRWVEHGTVRGIVEVVEPPVRFVFRWAGPISSEPDEGNTTTVEFTVTPEGDGARLRVVERGFGDLAVSEDEQRTYVDGNTEGWRGVLEQLRTYLDA